MTYSVYVVIHVSGKQYVGMTRNTIEHRWKQHLGDSSRPGASKLHRAIAKYGAENFAVSLVSEHQTIAECEAAEIFEIQKRNTMVDGYNILPGGHQSSGMLGKKHSEHTKLKFSVARKGKKRPEHSLLMAAMYEEKIRPHLCKKGSDHHGFGKQISEEITKKLSSTLTGIKISEATIQKREETKNRKKEEGFRFKRLSLEQVQMIKEERLKGKTIRELRTLVNDQVSLSSIKDLIAGRTYRDVK